MAHQSPKKKNREGKRYSTYQRTNRLLFSQMKHLCFVTVFTEIRLHSSPCHSNWTSSWVWPFQFNSWIVKFAHPWCHTSSYYLWACVCARGCNSLIRDILLSSTCVPPYRPSAKLEQAYTRGRPHPCTNTHTNKHSYKHLREVHLTET